MVGAAEVSAQVVFEPSSSSVYDLLNRLSVKGVIEFNDELKPLSRVELADRLIEAANQNDKLTSLEREEIDYYKKEFAPELALKGNVTIKEDLQFFNIDDVTGFRFFLFRSDDFTLNLDPILGFDIKNRFDEGQTHRRNGLQFHGYLKNNFGYSFYFRDNEERGERVDRTRSFSPEPGFNLSQNNPKTIEYVDVQGLVSYSWDNGNISIGKQYIEWGSGVSGKLILSNKAPSFPFVKLEFSPVNWLKFVYVHGWLHSALIDSSTTRTTLVKERNSYSQREKYIAAHMVSVYPFSNLSVSLGESMVYSDKLEFAYFIPILFFRTVDHYLSDSSNSGDNAQLFLNAVYKNYELRTKLYTTLFVDELSITNFLKGTNLSAIGFTAGISFVDPFIENSELSFEYTRLNPFVYMNSNDAQLFTSHNYQLGHWIGSNAHQFYAEYNQSFLRGLRLKIWGEYVRKGQKELPEEQYMLPYPKFLYGDKLSMTNIGLILSYEVLHNLFGQISFAYSNISDENALRTPDYQLGRNYSFSLSVHYGI